MIATMWLGAFLDLVQKQHIKTVVKQKWKLQSSLMKLNTAAKDMIMSPKKLFSDDEDEVSEESESDSEEQGVTDPKQIIAQHEQLEKEAAQLAQKYRQQKRRYSVGGSPKQQAQAKKAKKAVELSPDQVFSPASLYEPIRGLESEIARNCQSLLSKLSKTLEKTDQPLRLLMIKVDFSFAVKITGIIFSALVSQFFKRKI
jgi:leucyl aminopeptidase (aminopeptidase T)